MKQLKDLTEKQLAWLQKHFKNTKNAVLAEKLGISESGLHRLARQYGLKKTRQFMRKTQRATSEAAKASHLRHGTYPPKGYRIPRSEEYQFKKGETPVQRLGKRKEAARIAKAVESRRQTWKVEHARAVFGLEQKTRLKVRRQPIKKIQARYYLRKRGYIIDDLAFVAYYDENTRRAYKVEARPRRERFYDFKPITDKQST